ncbi:MAG: fibronectin type III domain-containing protein [Planctomycetales bacterium]|nr:fibronectin type III domain-containing protein [Planctomycetales bacterium]
MVSDSRDITSAIQSDEADAIHTPRDLWRVGTSDCGVYAQGHGLVLREKGASGESLSLIGENGVSQWRTDVPRLASDILPITGAVPADDAVVIQWLEQGGLGMIHGAFALSDGQKLWESQPIVGGSTRLPSGLTALDWNADGIDDVLGFHFGLYVLDGATGQLLFRTSSPLEPYFMVTPTQADNDAQEELLLHAGFYPRRVIDDDFESVLWSGDDDRPFPYRSIVTCPTGAAAVGSSYLHPATLVMTDLSSGQDTSIVVLSGGLSYSNEGAALADGASLQQLTSTYAHPDLLGSATAGVVVGEADGWLYFLDACTLELQHAVLMPGAVGAMAFVRLANGGAELAVSTSDGYLYGLRQFALIAPNNVLDIDPQGDPSQDIDVLLGTTRAAASWSPVTGADKYEVALIRDATNEFVDGGDWREVTSTEAHFSPLALSPDTLYRFAVRASGPAGDSPIATSDGFVVVIDDRYVAGGGCTCSPADGNHPSISYLIFAAILWTRIGRARRT